MSKAGIIRGAFNSNIFINIGEVNSFSNLGDINNSLINMSVNGYYNELTPVVSFNPIVTNITNGVSVVVPLVLDGSTKIIVPAGGIILQQSFSNNIAPPSGNYDLYFEVREDKLFVSLVEKATEQELVLISQSVELASPSNIVQDFNGIIDYDDSTGWDFEVDVDGTGFSSLTKSSISGEGTSQITQVVSETILPKHVLRASYSSGNFSSGDYNLGLISNVPITNNLYQFSNTHKLVCNAVGEGVKVINNDCFPSNGSGTDQPFTVEVWLRNIAIGAGRTFFVLRDTSDNSVFITFGFTADNRLVTQFIKDAGAVNRLNRQSGNLALSTSIFYHIVMTYDGSETVEGIKMYINGVEFASYFDNSTGTYDGMRTPTGDTFADIGNSVGGATSNVEIQTFRTFNRALLQGEIQGLFNSGLPLGLTDVVRASCTQENLLNNSPNAQIGVNGTNEGTVTYTEL